MLDLISAQTVGCGCVLDLRSLKVLDDDSLRRKVVSAMAGSVEREGSVRGVSRDDAGVRARRRKKRKARRKLLWIA